MKSVLISTLFLLTGCAHSGNADLMRGEVFVSENRQHTIQFNLKQIYTFSFEFGDSPRKRKKTSD